MKKLLLSALVILAQMQSFAEGAKPVPQPPPVNLANRAVIPSGDKNYLILTGLGVEPEDLNIIIIQVSRNLFYSFKYCSNKLEDKAGLFQQVRSAYLSDTENEANNALAEKLFYSSSCEGITKYPVYGIHLDPEDALSKNIQTGEEKTSKNTILKPISLGSLLPSTAVLGFGVMGMRSARVQNNTVGLFKFLTGKGVVGRKRIGLAILMYAAAPAAYYLGAKNAEEYHALSMLDQFINRQGIVLKVDGRISETKALLEYALPQAVKDGYISVL